MWARVAARGAGKAVAQGGCFRMAAVGLCQLCSASFSALGSFMRISDITGLHKAWDLLVPNLTTWFQTALALSRVLFSRRSSCSELGTNCSIRQRTPSTRIHAEVSGFRSGAAGSNDPHARLRIGLGCLVSTCRTPPRERRARTSASSSNRRGAAGAPPLDPFLTRTLCALRRSEPEIQGGETKICSS